MNTTLKLAVAALVFASAVPASAMDLKFDIQNTGSHTLSIVQVNGGDNLLEGDIGPGQSATVYLSGLGDEDCEHVVTVTTENADEFEVEVNLCEIDGMSIDDEELNVY